MKSEPEVFSIGDLKRQKKSGWDGVRNYQARNYLREMKRGDLVLFYHSNAEPPGIAGIARVCGERESDPTQFDKKSEYFDPKSKKENPTWDLVTVEFVAEFPLLPLERLKAEKSLAGMALVQKGSRLSVMPVAEKDWLKIMEMVKQ